MMLPNDVSSFDLLALRYPIGKRAPRTAFSAESRKAAIDAVAEMPGNLRQAVAGLTDAQLDTLYRPAGWSVRQVVHHLADSHLVLYTRAKLALTDDNPPVALWDEVNWAELPDAKSMAIDASLAIIDAIHARFVHLLRALTAEQCGRTLQHPIWGVIPVDELVEICVWHGKHHVAHICGLRERSGW